MGNCSCINRSAVVSLADDDWDEWEWTAAGAGSPGRPKQLQLKESLLHGSTWKAEDPHHLDSDNPTVVATAGAAGSTHEVKIMISKKELEKLVGKTGEGVERLQQALEGLLGSRGWDWEQVAREAATADAAGHPHHWRPSLQSIPEGAE